MAAAKGAKRPGSGRLIGYARVSTEDQGTLGIKAAAPGRTLQQIAAQLEAMRERTPRGGTRWHHSSVKHLLARAERLGLTGAASLQIAPKAWA